MERIRFLNRVGLAVFVLAFSVPAFCQIMGNRVYINYTPAIHPRDTVHIFFNNGPFAQRVDLALMRRDGTELARTSSILSAMGAVQLSWTNSGAALDSAVIGIGVEQSTGMRSTVIIQDSSLEMTNVFTEHAMIPARDLGLRDHGHGGGEGGHTHGPAAASVETFQNYPNPFMVSEGTRFACALRGAASRVSIRIWSIAGRLVKTLEIPNPSSPSALSADGRYLHLVSWDGRDDSGNFVGTGVYIAVLVVEGSGQTTSTQLRIAAIGDRQ